MSSDGDNEKKLDFFCRIAWAAGTACALSENSPSALEGAACPSVLVLSSQLCHEMTFVTHTTLLPAWLELTNVPPGWSPAEHRAQLGGSRTLPGTALAPGGTGSVSPLRGAGGSGTSTEGSLCQTRATPVSGQAQAATNSSHCQGKDGKAPKNKYHKYLHKLAGLLSPCAHCQNYRITEWLEGA